MAADSRDPVTGAYIFSDTGAPDIGVDPTLVSAQANDVGTRIIRDNLAALNAYPYKREGLMGYALDTDQDYVYNGTGWVLFRRAVKTQVTTFGNNWEATPSYVPTLVESGGMVFLTGAARIQSGGSLDDILTIPVGLRPSGQQFLNHFRTTSGSASGQLHVDSAGVVSAPTNYRTGSMSAGHSIPLGGAWPKA
ncbi:MULTISPECIES: hypothetical protein [unclassified Microbacterium]|uniref:hypothetical protein n=1 Tax=unclassified Microbacterium TaxID=2609290 RepID=UPI00246939A9|nr:MULTISPECIES: hypothetical protein [unclassified Microbacterium]MDH5134079.1 hypothetical protein [Microbacterium sp. RD10]MDH5136817.1 hypothetical protein [Microbacterium sp. RD11]MDH5146402.1 hypothetical protein [Microbacterium sp. RD12]MDH5155136.1 hypothetical protein [Microbacterium sp. RD06]MDH5166582.1 hypothetical protein [Microbacterium sp. RD02]